MNRHHTVMTVLLALMLVGSALAQGSGGAYNPRERGFAADKAYQAGDIDAIDLATGNVVLTIPIGPSYSVNGGFSYGFKLTTNAELWDYREFGNGCTCQQGSILIECNCTIGFPDTANNCGFSWRLSLGDLIDSRDGMANPPAIGTYTYVSPDGAQHALLYSSLHEGETAQEAKFTRDGTYIRFQHAETSNLATVELPDGTVHTFEKYAPYKWRLLKIEDHRASTPNQVAVWYEDANDVPLVCDDAPAMSAWTITDNTTNNGTIVQRRHQVCFSDGRVDHVLLAAPGGTVAKYTLRYHDATSIHRPAFANGLEVISIDEEPYGDQLDVRFLKEVELPDEDHSTYTIGDTATDGYYTDGGSNTAPKPVGGAKKVKLPTGGTVSWAFQRWYHWMRLLPEDGCPLCPRQNFMSEWPGIAKRTLTELDSSPKEWTYTPWSGWYEHTELPEDEGSAQEERRTYVTDPAGNDTVHYFRAVPHPMNPGIPTSWDYALPFTRREPSGNNRRLAGPFLSVEYYLGAASIPTSISDPGPPSGTKLRSIFVEYSHDPSTLVDLGYRDVNRYQTLTKTVYHDDAEKYLQTAYSNFDGLGHFRKAVTTGTFTPSLEHASFTGYNPPLTGDEPSTGWNETEPPAYVQYPSADYTVWPLGKPWILGTFDAKWEAEGTSRARTEYCVARDADRYPVTGFVARVRNLVSTAALPARLPQDTMAVSTDDGRGNAATETFYGGDSGGVGTESVCAATLPTATYSLTHTYAYGARATSQYTGVPFLSLDQTIDPSGVVTQSRDTAGVQVNYEYDGLFRLRREKPQGAGAWVEYAYTKASGSTGPMVEVITRPYQEVSGTPGSLGHMKYDYDGFGRLTKARRLLPTTAEAWSQKVIEYDKTGRKLRESEEVANGTTPTNWTSYKYCVSGCGQEEEERYDAFGRVQSITQPDGQVVTFGYQGDRQKTRTVSIFSKTSGGADQTVSATTTETSDNLGRLVSVVEPLTATTSLTAAYTYDLMGHLASTVLSTILPSGVTVTQSGRTFQYDGRGFLVKEDLPEKSIPSPLVGARIQECPSNDVCSFFDARGHVTKRYDGDAKLLYTYTADERPLEVRDGMLNRPLIEYMYRTENHPPNLYRGKLFEVDSHNYLSDGKDYAVYKTYDFVDPLGRVCQKGTHVSVNEGNWEWRFGMELTWNDLNQVETLTYPGAGIYYEPRILRYGYTKGALSSVQEETEDGQTQYTFASQFTYHPNGLLQSVLHGNGVSDIQDIANGMARPDSIGTTGALDPLSGTPNWSSGTYQYDGAGNIKKIGSDKYRYDWSSRVLDGCVRGCASTQAYTYDAFGNITAIKTGSTTRTIGVSTVTNRLTGVGYDAAGNVTSYPSGSTTFSYTWTPDGRMRGFQSTGGSLGGNNREYIYDGDGERVAYVDLAGSPVKPKQMTFAIRGLDEKVLREVQLSRGPSDPAGTMSVTAWSKDYVYGGGRLLATVAPNLGVRHAHLDHLGSVLFMTDSAGFNAGHHVFYPYGQEAPYASGQAQYDTQRMKFTGHERDTQRTLGGNWGDDLDYMHARYYSQGVGRFVSVDPGAGWATSPQSWNRYVYVRDNPLAAVDDDGRQEALVVTRPELLVLAPSILPAVGAAAAETVPVVAVGVGVAMSIHAIATAEPLSDLAVEQIRAANCHSTPLQAEHTKGKRPSTREKHEEGARRKNKDRGGEKADEGRRPPRRRPPGHKGPWPEKAAPGLVPSHTSGDAPSDPSTVVLTTEDDRDKEKP